MTLSTYCVGRRKLSSLAAIAAKASCSFTAADLTIRVTGGSNHKGEITGNTVEAESSCEGIELAVASRKSARMYFNLRLRKVTP